MQRNSADTEDLLSGTSGHTADNRIQTEAWIRLYGERLHTAMFLFTNDWHVAEDLCQETFMQCLKKAHLFSGNSDPFTWLYSMTKNRAIDHYRRRGSKMATLPRDDEENLRESEVLLDRSATSGIANLLQKETVEMVRCALQSLDPPEEKILQMREMDDCSYEEIGMALGITVGTVRSRLHHARNVIYERFLDLGLSEALDTPIDERSKRRPSMRGQSKLPAPRNRRSYATVM